MFRNRWIPAVVTAVVLSAGCGSSSDGVSGDTTTASADTTTASADTTTAPADTTTASVDTTAAQEATTTAAADSPDTTAASSGTTGTTETTGSPTTTTTVEAAGPQQVLLVYNGASQGAGTATTQISCTRQGEGYRFEIAEAEYTGPFEQPVLKISAQIDLAGTQTDDIYDAQTQLSISGVENVEASKFLAVYAATAGQTDNTAQVGLSFTIGDLQWAGALVFPWTCEGEALPFGG